MSELPCADLTDVTLADEDTSSKLTDNAKKAFQGNVAAQVTQPGGQLWNQAKQFEWIIFWMNILIQFWIEYGIESFLGPIQRKNGYQNVSATPTPKSGRGILHIFL